MTTYNLSSDYHLGTQRAAHTTRASAALLQFSLYQKAKKATKRPNSLCLGDVFDRSSNPEAVIVQGYEVAKNCEKVLSGNHDMENRSGLVTSLNALHAVLGSKIVVATDLSKPYFDQFKEFWMVPHHASQEVFEQALKLAAEDASEPGQNHLKYLILHCNYNCPFDTEDSTLNLSPEMAEYLLQTFDRVFTGHEHNPKTHFDERLVIVGNVHATSFSDISDKFIWHLDVETDTLTKTCIWEKSYAYRELNFGDPVPDLRGVQFVDVVGAEPVDNGVEVAEYVRSVWNAGSTLIAVRNNVQIIDHLADADGIDTSSPALVNLGQRINDDLEGSDLQPYYQHLVKRVEAL